MSRFRVVLFLLAFAVAYHATVHAAPPMRPGQPHPDEFQYNGASLQPYSTLAPQAKVTRTVLYRLITEPGCNTGTVPSDMQSVEAQAHDNLLFNLVQDSTNYQFTVHINCGSGQIAICSSVNIFCLGRGFPYNNDVDISDIISTYPYLTRISILMHEIIGHALAVWNEQYCIGDEPIGNPCYGAVHFASTPNWPDIMNTGPDSRHLLSVVECERWARTMYDVPCAYDTGSGSSDPTPACVPVYVGWDSCVGRWRMLDGTSYDPSTQIWWNPDSQPEWGPCDQYSDRRNFNDNDGWFSPGSAKYLDGRTYWSVSPAC